MAAGHYQFEAIHPFTDGNGRTGRVLNILYLIQEDLLALPILYLSRFIIAYKTDYDRLLLAVTCERAWEPWVLFMLRAVEATAHWDTGKILAIRALSEAAAAYVRERLPKIYSRELVDAIFEQSYCRIAQVGDAAVGLPHGTCRISSQLACCARSRSARKSCLPPRLMQLLADDAHEVRGYEDLVPAGAA